MPPDARPPTCPADSPDWGPVPVDSLGKAARDAHDAGDHCRALRLAELRARISPDPRLYAFMAREEQTLGMLLDAGRNAARCVREAEADASLRLPRELLETCRRLVRETGIGGVATVTVRGPASLPRGLRVFVAGEWRDASLNEPSSMLPGSVDVAAFVPGQLCCRQHADLARGDQLELEIGASGDGPTCGPWRITLSGAAP